MPCPREVAEPVERVEHRDCWPPEFEALAGELAAAGVPGVVAADARARDRDWRVE